MTHFKKILTTSFLSLFLGILMAQLPETFSYQAAARDKTGKVVANKNIIVEISILNHSDGKSTEYQEIHTPTTNEFGLFSLEIGSGQPTFNGALSNFSLINWEDGAFSVKVRVDFGDAEQTNGLVNMGDTKLQAVPYSFISTRALVAESLATPVSLLLNDLGNVSISNPQHNQTLIWNANTSKWTAGESGSFLDSNGSTDLIGDWNISSSSILLESGNFSLASGDFKVNTGNLIMQGGAVLLSGGHIEVSNGSISTDTIQLQFGRTINKISDDGSLAGNSNSTIPTEQAVKTYVDNAGTSGGGTNGSSGAWFTTESTVFISDSRFVSIGTGSPSDKIHFNLAENEGFLVTGLSTGTVPELGVGTRMAFYPSRAAFKAGRLQNISNAWNDANTGIVSASFGQDNISSGDYSFSSGFENKSSGSASTTFGSNNTATGLSSFSVGNNSHAQGDGAFSAGNNSLSKGDGAFSVGNNTTAPSYTETALGIFNYSVGDNTSGWTATETLFSIGNGNSESTRSNAFVIMKYGGTGVGLGQEVPIAMFQVGTPGNGTNALSNSWDTFSDKRLKKDFSSIKNPLHKINQLSGYYYFWKVGTDNSRQAGVIAQEVQKVMPEIVTTNTDGILSVDYSKLTVLLIEGTKAQQKQIKKLEKENRLLTIKLEEQNIRIESIERYVKAAANVKMNK